MINNNFSITSRPTNTAINFIKETQEKFSESAKKIASGDVNIVEEVLNNNKYYQQVNAASKVIETENKTIGVFLDVFV